MNKDMMMMDMMLGEGVLSGENEDVRGGLREGVNVLLLQLNGQVRGQREGGIIESF